MKLELVFTAILVARGINASGDQARRDSVHSDQGSVALEEGFPSSELSAVNLPQGANLARYLFDQISKVIGVTSASDENYFIQELSPLLFEIQQQELAQDAGSTDEIPVTAADFSESNDRKDQNEATEPQLTGDPPSTDGPEKETKPSTVGPQEQTKPSTDGPQEQTKPSTVGPQEETKPSTDGPEEETTPSTDGPEEETTPSTVDLEEEDYGNISEKFKRRIRDFKNFRFSMNVDLIFDENTIGGQPVTIQRLAAVTKLLLSGKNDEKMAHDQTDLETQMDQTDLETQMDLENQMESKDIKKTKCEVL